MPGAVSLGGWGPILSPNPANVPGTFPLKERHATLVSTKGARGPFRRARPRFVFDEEQEIAMPEERINIFPGDRAFLDAWWQMRLEEIPGENILRNMRAMHNSVLFSLITAGGRGGHPLGPTSGTRCAPQAKTAGPHGIAIPPRGPVPGFTKAGGPATGKIPAALGPRQRCVYLTVCPQWIAT